jgi:Domain of unknown function (DUF4190)
MVDERSAPPRVSLLAYGSLVCGIIWIFGLGSICAVILGHVALRRVRRTGQAGRGLAVIGLVLGYVGVVVTFVLLLGGGVSVEGGA